MYIYILFITAFTSSTYGAHWTLPVLFLRAPLVGTVLNTTTSVPIGGMSGIFGGAMYLGVLPWWGFPKNGGYPPKTPPPKKKHF